MNGDYSESFPRGVANPPSKFSAPPNAREPDAATILARGQSEGEWLVPVEMALALTTSAMKAVVYSRTAKGQICSRNARIIAHGDRYFATVFFPKGPSDLFMPLDCWAMGELR